MPNDEATFLQHRPRLFGLAYRMLGTKADAEDVLQDAYLRWQQTRHDELKSPEAWLVTVVTRLSIDRLRDAKRERETYTGPWLPEPLVGEELANPERVSELASDVSFAFLMMMERLSPEERAVFLLREVFDMGYPEVAQMLGKSEDACRQMVHRAKERVRQERPRFQVNPVAHRQLLERFIAATGSGKREDLLALFAKDVRFSGDGGGKVRAVLRVLEGAERLVRFYTAISRLVVGHSLSYRHAEINGEPGLLQFLDGRLVGAITLVTDGVHIFEIYSVRNPDKLKHIHVP